MYSSWTRLTEPITAHRANNTQTAIWNIPSQQNFESDILITATPMFNAIDGLTGLVSLLGSRGVARLKSKLSWDPDLKARSSSLDPTPFSKIKEYFEDIPTTSPLRLNLLKSSMLRRSSKRKT
ncbi:hypothetical protein N7455_004080 [Penicillium solitum]|uniref:uncharacterized protein n=1 Tax=Penicillium solitum TaxID=60172 RepID=UPI0018578020|nr:hypothetical protein HAV15_003998 [Penicillium sp. str. \